MMDDPRRVVVQIHATCPPHPASCCLLRSHLRPPLPSPPTASHLPPSPSPDAAMQVEACDLLGGFTLLQSMAGGTGAGLGTYVAQVGGGQCVLEVG